MFFKQYAAMFKARTMEFIRDRGTFIWNMLMPIFLVFGLAFTFSGGEDALFKIGVTGPETGRPSILSMEQVQVIEYPDADTALGKLERHQIDMLIDTQAREFAINKESSKGRLLKTIFSDQQAAAVSTEFSERMVTGRALRYVDWLVPGVIGMNMMFSSLFGVGFVIVRYRKNGVLKRFKATPVSALNFVAAQATSRLLIVLLTSIFVFTATNFFLRFMMLGSYVALLLVITLGILCMISLGLAFASRMKSEEMAGGILNVATFPMLALSGVFFSLEGSPQILRTISYLFPLTHFTEAARKIMLDGAGIVQIAPNLLFLGGFTALFLGLAAVLFKWE